MKIARNDRFGKITDFLNEICPKGQISKLIKINLTPKKYRFQKLFFSKQQILIFLFKVVHFKALFSLKNILKLILPYTKNAEKRN